VLGEACRQMRTWQKAGLRLLTISVNVSTAEFREKGFIEGVIAILAESGLEARYLELELTERVLMKDVGLAADSLQKLKSIGIRLALDDFGTGYSSLSYLRQFPIDVLKIDRSFVQQIANETNRSPIVNAIIAMGESLNYLVVAQGVETEEQRQYLQARGCMMGQGYLFSRPVSGLQFAGLLQSKKDAANEELNVNCPV
jgi:EAL domain-containing protein (putative c-di-GMP-specific phosphodiesterase class I)